MVGGSAATGAKGLKQNKTPAFCASNLDFDYSAKENDAQLFSG